MNARVRIATRGRTARAIAGLGTLLLMAACSDRAAEDRKGAAGSARLRLVGPDDLPP